MIDKFLKAKHWQLFSLTFGLPIIFQVAMMIGLLSNIATKTPPDATSILNFISVMPLMMILMMGMQFGWMWSVAIGLQKKVPDTVKMKVKTFKLFLFIPIIYSFIFAAFFGVISGVFTAFDAFMPHITTLLVIILPLHFLAIFCMIYSLYFIAKTLKTVEMQREAYFSDFAGEFFMIWFYPIGIWIVQPRINKLAEV
jgi:hypothetical protein